MGQVREVVRAMERRAERSGEPEHEGHERKARIDLAQAPIDRGEDLDPDNAAEEEEKRGEEASSFRRRPSQDDERDRVEEAANPDDDRARARGALEGTRRSGRHGGGV